VMTVFKTPDWPRFVGMVPHAAALRSRRRRDMLEIFEARQTNSSP
jgi:hypothetical protein